MRKKRLLKVGVTALCVLTVLVIGLLLLRKTDQDRYAEGRDTMPTGFGQLHTVEWNGTVYREKPAITTILITGIDKTDDPGDTAVNAFRNGRQADFLMLIAVDHTDKRIHRLQIDRDTMTDIAAPGIFGNETDTRKLRICLSYSFGKTEKDHANYTIRTVSNLLEGVEIDAYYTISYADVSLLNDTLGGVSVHVDSDMSSVNPEWTKDAEVTLRGEEAETFLRFRPGAGEGTSEEWMALQNEFMQKTIEKMHQNIMNHPSYAEKLVQTMRNLGETNLTGRQLLDEIIQSKNYKILPVDHPEGEYRIGDDGFVEFHMREGAVAEWVLEHLYARQ